MEKALRSCQSPIQTPNRCVSCNWVQNRHSISPRGLIGSWTKAKVSCRNAIPFAPPPFAAEQYFGVGGWGVKSGLRFIRIAQRLAYGRLCTGNWMCTLPSVGRACQIVKGMLSSLVCLYCNSAERHPKVCCHSKGSAVSACFHSPHTAKNVPSKDSEPPASHSASRRWDSEESPASQVKGFCQEFKMRRSLLLFLFI